MSYLIALKLGTQKGDIRAHLGTKFGWNTINICEVICNYSQKNYTNMLSCPQGKPCVARS